MDAAVWPGKPPLSVHTPDLTNDRTRLDLMWHDSRLGLRGPTQADGGFVFRPAEDPDADPILKTMCRDFEADPPPVAQAQVRFRCGGKDNRGVWIDASRSDIEHLFEQRTWLEATLARGWIVELGQRGEAAIEGPDGPELAPATPHEWLPSFDRAGNEIPLRSTIAAFSQPGPKANRALIAAAFEILDASGIDRLTWFEWGAGYGNLTAAMFSRLGGEGTATEASIATMLEENGREFFPTIRTARRSAEADVAHEIDARIWVIDPPRPGFGRLLESLTQRRSKPDWILAFHCHESGLRNDSRILFEAGAQLTNWSSVDLFPGSAHREVISLWKVT